MPDLVPAKQPRPGRRPRPGIDAGAVALLVAACGLAVLHAFHFDHTCDDAYISFRYVRHLVEGHGLVFNTGERVMGFSNPLWVALLVPFQAAGVAAPQAARLLGVGLSLGTLALVWRHLVRAHASRGPAAVALAWLASNGTFALWMLGGLEGPLVAWLLTWACLLALEMPPDAGHRRYAALGAALGLAAWTRPEAAAYAVPVALWLWARRPSRARAGQVLVMLAVVAAFYAALAAATWAYYGDPLPNTYYAKDHPLSWAVLGRGWKWTAKFVTAYHGLPVIALLGWAAATRLRLSSPGWLPVWLLAAFVAFFMRVGGDALVYHRMWLWTLPLLALLAAEAVARLRPAVAATATLLVVGLGLPYSFVGPGIAYLERDEALLEGVHALSRTLAELPTGTVVAANNIGILSWHHDLRVIDMLGLTDRHIARAPGKELGIPGHESHDGRYVLDAAPDLVFVGMPRVLEAPVPPEVYLSQAYRTDRELLADGRLQTAYTYAHLRVSDGRVAPLFRRRGAPPPRHPPPGADGVAPEAARGL